MEGGVGMSIDMIIVFMIFAFPFYFFIGLFVSDYFLSYENAESINFLGTLLWPLFIILFCALILEGIFNLIVFILKESYNILMGR